MPAWALKTAGGGGNADWFLNQLAIARATLPDAGFDTIIGSDFGETITSELADVSGVADASPFDNVNGGVVVVEVGDNVTAPSSARLQLTGAGSHVQSLAGVPWFMAALVKYVAPLDTTQLGQTRADMVALWADVDNWVAMGVLASSGGSVTNWVGSVDNGGTIQTSIGPALDGEESPVWHLHQAWIDPDGNLHFAIDGQEFNNTIAAANVPGNFAMLSPTVQRFAVGDAAAVLWDKIAVFVKSPTVGDP